jgi:tetratricopeptide (TPR) repeat protein
MTQALTDVAAKLVAAERLYHASAAGDLAAVVAALQARVHPDGYRAPDGSTALIAAARSNAPAVVQELLAAGAKPGIRTAAGETAQQVARRHGFEAVGRLLPAEEKAPFGALFGAAAKLAGGVSAAARELAEMKRPAAMAMSGAASGAAGGAASGAAAAAAGGAGAGAVSGAAGGADASSRPHSERRSWGDRPFSRDEAENAREEESAEQRAIESSLRSRAAEEDRARRDEADRADRVALAEQQRMEAEERSAAEAVAAAEEAREVETRRAAAAVERERLVEHLKAEGNAVFREGRYSDAAELYSQAADLDPHNGVLFSNRSGALTALGAYDRALADADRCVNLRPEWPKGHARRAAALHGLKRFLDAVYAYDRALALEPADEVLVAARRQSSFALAIEAE